MYRKNNSIKAKDTAKCLILHEIIIFNDFKHLARVSAKCLILLVILVVDNGIGSCYTLL